jgi:hypothetical protein
MINLPYILVGLADPSIQINPFNSSNSRTTTKNRNGELHVETAH